MRSNEATREAGGRYRTPADQRRYVGMDFYLLFIFLETFLVRFVEVGRSPYIPGR